MSIAKIRDGLVEIYCDGECRYVRPSFWERSYLLWVFRNFRRLPVQVLSSGQQQMLERLARRARAPLRSERIDPLLVIGRAEFSRLGRKPVSRLAPKPAFEKLLATGSGPQAVSAPVPDTASPPASTSLPPKPESPHLPVLVKPTPAPILLPGKSRVSRPSADRNRLAHPDWIPISSRSRESAEPRSASPTDSKSNVRWAWLAMAAAAVILSAGLVLRLRTSPDTVQQARPQAASTASPATHSSSKSQGAPTASKTSSPMNETRSQASQPTLASQPIVDPASRSSLATPGPNRISPRSAPNTAVTLAPPPEAAALPNAIAVSPNLGSVPLDALPADASGIATGFTQSPGPSSDPLSSERINTAAANGTPITRPLGAMLAPQHVIYPAFPKSEKLGTGKEEVIVRAVVSAKGSVESVQIVKGDPALASAVANAVRQWRYSPYIANGHAVSVETTTAFTILGPDAVTVRFLPAQ